MDESLITPELEQAVGRESAPREVAITPELVGRVVETVENGDAHWQGATAPPYILLPFETPSSYPEPPAAPMSLVTGDDWILHRRLRIGERLTYAGGLVSAHERFGSRFGHNLVLRFGWTFRDAAGDVVAEIGRGMIRYREPEPERRAVPAGTPEPPRPGGNGRPAPTPADVRADPASILGAGDNLAPGDPLPSAIIRPTMAQVVRYCGLTWNFTPIFFDPEEAMRAGLPGTIVPGPLKVALLTRYLAAWAGPAGEVRAVRAAFRRPDLTARPITIGGAVTEVAAAGGRRLLDCEVWFENEAGARSVIGAATVALPRA